MKDEAQQFSLQGEGISVGYQQNIIIPKMDVQIPKGKITSIIGPNGCGKSTLAKHFNAILLPESGTVLVEGMDTKDEDKIYDIRQTVGMVFQNPDNQIVATVVEEDVAFALENLGVPPEEMRRRVDDAMKMAGIYEYRERAPHNLSGGQQQRVAIARALIHNRSILLVDEGTSALDQKNADIVEKSLLSNPDLTLILISHHLSDERKAQFDHVYELTPASSIV